VHLRIASEEIVHNKKTSPKMSIGIRSDAYKRRFKTSLSHGIPQFLNIFTPVEIKHLKLKFGPIIVVKTKVYFGPIAT
jgi:hypothetical protein